MKSITFIFALIILSHSICAQILPETGQGERVFSPRLNQSVSTVLLNLNTGTQAIGADYYFSSKAVDPSNYNIFRIGISAKATEGVGALISKGQFSPGSKISGSITKIRIFAPRIINHKFDDWGSINVSYVLDKYKLFKKDSVFKNQVYDTSFRSFNLGINYTMMIGGNRDYVNVKAGYERRSNFSDLTAIEVNDIRGSYDSSTATRRELVKKVAAKEGSYREFDSFVWGISYTKLPKLQRKVLLDTDNEEITEDKTETTEETVTVNGISFKVKHEITKKVPKLNPNYKSLKIGYTVYFNSLAAALEKPVSNLGALIFLMGPNKDDVLTSKFGIDLQFKDIMDSKRLNNGLIKRFNIALTTLITL